jgi:DNA-binding NarL/FixJ family response regulator
MASLRPVETTIEPAGSLRVADAASTIGGPRLAATQAVLVAEPEVAAVRATAVAARASVVQLAALHDEGVAPCEDLPAQTTAANDAFDRVAINPCCCRGTRLPRRQQQVLDMFAQGKSQKEIGFDLGIAGSTVATHLRKALDRLSIERQLVPYAASVLRDGAELPEDAGHVPLPSVLTSAEADIVRAVLRGASNAEIARVRGRSVRTVANQIASMFRKLSVGSRSELYARAAEWRAGSAATNAIAPSSMFE